MKATELINEVFDSDVKGRVIKAGPNFFATSADIGDRTIIFNASIYGHSGSNVWEIDFIEKTAKGPTYGKSGSGNEMQVFSFVIESLKELVSRYAPAAIVFNSHKADGNRSKLYIRMLSRVSQVLPGYKAAGVSSTDSSDTFTIAKDDVK